MPEVPDHTGTIAIVSVTMIIIVSAGDRALPDHRDVREDTLIVQIATHEAIDMATITTTAESGTIAREIVIVTETVSGIVTEIAIGEVPGGKIALKEERNGVKLLALLALAVQQ
jgi:hypothetical protein